MRIRIVFGLNSPAEFQKKKFKKGLEFKTQGSHPRINEFVVIRVGKVEYQFQVDTITWVCSAKKVERVDVDVNLWEGRP